MTEAFLHYLFDSRKLGQSFQTTEGEILEVLEFGELNKSSGPDFLQSKIQFDGKTWAGNIEFHINSSDWNNHGHQHDRAYDNVIAHFVLNHDKDIYINRFKLPVVELKNLVDENDFKHFMHTLKMKSTIPCQANFSSINENVMNKRIQSAFDERINRKSLEIVEMIKSKNGDQNKVKLLLTAKLLGGKHNAVSMQKLVEMIDQSMLAHLNYDSLKTQALFHGLSGLIPKNSNEEYVQSLTNEFEYLKSLFQLRPMSKVEWHFYGMRPPSHPTFRIMQLANLLLERKEQDEYWKFHYNFKNQTKKRHDTMLSEALNERIAINVNAPFDYAMAWLKGGKFEMKNAKQSLLKLKPESNRIISNWQKLGVKPKNALETQGLLELKNEWCNRKKCLFCSIGRTVLNR